ncbi:MAG: hypothetical protein M0021_07445 [Clostridia bacterium]|nr:hypothetical protein [Clostridia bacterium]
MSDGRDVVSALIAELNDNYPKVVEQLPDSKTALEEIIEGYKNIQKKFYLKTQGGTDAATECTTFFNEMVASLNSGAGTQEIQEKFNAFAEPSRNLIHTASTWVIRMT